MAELNLTSVSDDQWKAFIKDIADVQDKHDLILVPTFKFNVVEGMSYEWGAMRKPPKNDGDQVSETNTASDNGNTPAKK